MDILIGLIVVGIVVVLGLKRLKPKAYKKLKESIPFCTCKK